MPTQLLDQDLELAKFFTDVEPLRDWFDKAIVADKLPKRLLVIWGVGGIGKSSLLRMFRLNCKTAHVPVGLASGDEAKSAVDVLSRWAEDLKADYVTLPTFFKTYEHYRAIQAKVEDQTKATQKKLGDAAVKGAGKVAEVGTAAAVGAAVGSVIPGIGTIAGAVGGMGAEALADWLRGFLTKPDLDLYTDPTKKLTDDFLADMNHLASKQRIVLMLDAYEQMTALGDWTREVAQRLNENVLLVIAGRAMVNWGRQWSSWLMYAHVEELKPMPKRVMHELIRKYYATMRGGEPNPKQVNAIIEFSGGLPMVVNTAVQLWVKYGIEDFGAVKGEVVREVVERLREGVPPELYPLLETAAALRYFNKGILRAVSGMGDITKGYEELRRFPFVRSRAEGYALHDRVREMIEEDVRTDDPAKYRAVHERAAAYFEARQTNASTEEAERLGLERLYHRICTDEESGIKLFQEMAEETTRLHLIFKLRSLLQTLNSPSILRAENRAWWKYYQAKLLQLEAQWEKAKSEYAAILRDNYATQKLRAYVSCDLGIMVSRFEELSQENGILNAKTLLSESLTLAEVDNHTVTALTGLARVARFEGTWEEQDNYFNRATTFFRKSGDQYGLVLVMTERERTYARRGLWKRFFDSRKEALAMLSTFPTEPLILKSLVLGNWVSAVANAGRYAECERHADEALSITQRLKSEISAIQLLRDLGLAMCFQEKFHEASKILQQSLTLATSLEGESYISEYAGGLGVVGEILARQGHLDRAKQYHIQSLEIRRNNKVKFGEMLTLNNLGMIEVMNQRWEEAEDYFKRALDFKWYQAFHLTCTSLLGLTQVKYGQNEYPAIPLFFTKAEQLAQQYEYNDHLASLRLTQGHIVWDGHIHEWGKGFDAAFEFYKLALVYALRYNRFLLDEVLSGRPQGTPLRPIIPECLKRGEDGQKMLRALSEWWQTGKNDVGAPRPDTISPLPENIALLEAEKIAREREPGDGTKQKWVLEQIEAALV